MKLDPWLVRAKGPGWKWTLIANNPQFSSIMYSQRGLGGSFLCEMLRLFVCMVANSWLVSSVVGVVQEPEGQVSPAAAERQQCQSQAAQEEVFSGAGEHRLREQRPVHASCRLQHGLFLVFILLHQSHGPGGAQQHLYLHQHSLLHLEPRHLPRKCSSSRRGPAPWARTPFQRLLYAAFNVRLRRRRHLLPHVLQPDAGLRPGLPHPIQLLLQRRGLRLLPGPHALPPPPPPAQPHDGLLHVRPPAPPHQPVVGPPPPSPPPPGLRRLQPGLQLLRLPGLQRADCSLLVEAQL